MEILSQPFTNQSSKFIVIIGCSTVLFVSPVTTQGLAYIVIQNAAGNSIDAQAIFSWSAGTSITGAQTVGDTNLFRRHMLLPPGCTLLLGGATSMIVNQSFQAIMCDTLEEALMIL